jgi:hypothetical protein
MLLPIQLQRLQQQQQPPLAQELGRLTIKTFASSHHAHVFPAVGELEALGAACTQSGRRRGKS